MGFFEKKAPGEIGSYRLIYLGGHPEYPKSKAGLIEFKIFKDRFEFLPTMGTKSWFHGLAIQYGNVLDVQIVQRQVGTLEGILGGLDSRQLNQPNNIHFIYIDAIGNDVTLRTEMISGITVMGQAKKCLEFQDVIRINKIQQKFRRAQEIVRPTGAGDDIPNQITKLAALRDLGCLLYTSDAADD